MAEEEVVIVDNSNKRKVEELEQDVENCKSEGVNDASEAKRARFEEGVENEGENGCEKDKVDDVPQEEVDHSTGDGVEKSEEVPANGQQPLIGIEEPADEAAQEPSKEDGHEFVAEIAQKGVDDQPEVDISRKVEVPNNRVGVLIGKAGDTIRFLQYNSGAKIQITKDAEADPHSTSRAVELIGTLESINKAEKLIKDVIAEADAGGSPALVARGFSTVQDVTGEQIEIQVPNEKVGLIIGKGGETIKNLQTTSGARIQLIRPTAGDQSKERTVQVTGDRKQIELAREMIKEVINQIVRPSPLSRGHGQPALQPHGPFASQWGPQGAHPKHFTGYDHQPRGAYSSQSQQYPPTFGTYPPQSAPRGSYGQSCLPSQGNYNYGQSQGSEYGQRAPDPRGYGHGYNEGYTGPQQHPYGVHGGSQQTNYPTTGQYPGYGPSEQYGKPSSYGVPPQAQSYGQPRAREAPYQVSLPPTQSYGSSVPPQQPYPYASSVPLQQSYPLYNAVPAVDGYSQPQSVTACGPTYTQPAVPPVSSYSQPGGQQPAVYGQGGATGGYSSYPSQQGYAEQPAAANAGYGYQGQGDAAYAASNPGYATQPGLLTAYPAQPAVQAGAISGGYGAAAPAAAAGGKSGTPQG